MLGPEAGLVNKWIFGAVWDGLSARKTDKCEDQIWMSKGIRNYASFHTSGRNGPFASAKGKNDTTCRNVMAKKQPMLERGESSGTPKSIKRIMPRTMGKSDEKNVTCRIAYHHKLGRTHGDAIENIFSGTVSLLSSRLDAGTESSPATFTLRLTM